MSELILYGNQITCILRNTFLDLAALESLCNNLPSVFYVDETIKIPAFGACTKSELFDWVYEDDTAKLSYSISFTDRTTHREAGAPS